MSWLAHCIDQKHAEYYLIEELCPELLETTLEVLPDIDVRNQTVTEITEEFFSLFGQFPNSVILSKLSSYILLDHIKDVSRTKMDSVPILTARQWGNRNRKEMVMTTDQVSHFHAAREFNFARKRRTQESDIQE